MSTQGCPALHSHLTRIALVGLLALLVAPREVAMADAPGTVPIWSIFSQVDGTAIDLEVDGEGDIVDDAVGSVLVGWNSAYWPGEERGVYEFDVRSAPKLRNGARVFLYLSCLGHYLDGEAMSHHLSLFAGPGNGLVEPGDFQAGEFVTEFDGCDDYDPSGWWHDRIDVTRVVRRLMHRGAEDIVFVVHPDPRESASTGGILYNSYELSLIHGYVPATLEVEAKKQR